MKIYLHLFEVVIVTKMKYQYVSEGFQGSAHPLQGGSSDVTRTELFWVNPASFECQESPCRKIGFAP